MKHKWETLKSGVLKCGHWYVGQYITGWYLYNNIFENFGPFKSADEALKEMDKKAK